MAWTHFMNMTSTFAEVEAYLINMFVPKNADFSKIKLEKYCKV